MEIRIRIPTSWSAWRYCLKNPRYFIIGIYSYKRYLATRNSMLEWAAKFHKEEMAHTITRNKLIEARKELSSIKKR